MAEVFSPPPQKPPKGIEPRSELFRFITRWLASSRITWQRVRKVVVRLNTDTTQTGNVGTGEDDLISYNLTANILEGGQFVRITAWGTTANNSNTKTLKLYFGSLILTHSLPTSASGRWRVEALITPTQEDSQKYVSQLITESSQDVEVGSLTEDDSTEITIKCTGEATANNDIVQEGLVVELGY